MLGGDIVMISTTADLRPAWWARSLAGVGSGPGTDMQECDQTEAVEDIPVRPWPPALQTRASTLGSTTG